MQHLPEVCSQEFQRFSRALVQVQRDLVELRLRVGGQVCPPREVLRYTDARSAKSPLRKLLLLPNYGVVADISVSRDLRVSVE
jgi:hypothetical protein